MPYPSRFKLAIPLVLVAALAAGCSDGPSTEQLLARARASYAADQLGAAEKLYREVLRGDPQNSTAQTQLGLIHYEQGQSLQAYPLLQRAAQRQPDNLDVQLKFGLTALSISRFTEARDVARQILEKNQGQEEALFLLASTAVTAAEIDEVKALIATLREQDQDRAGYHLALGTIHLRQKDLTSAEKEFKAAIELNDKSAWSHVGLATTYWRRGDVPAAEQAFNTAVDLSPARSPIRIRHIDFLFSTGSVERATKILQEITERTPDALPPRVWLMKLACAERRDDKCASRVKEVLAQDPTNYDALFQDGVFNLASGDAQQAIREFEFLANTYAANEAQIRYQLALAYLAQARKTQNETDVRKLVESAEKNLSDAVKLDPRLEPAVLLLAELKIRHGTPAAAIDPLARLVKERPKNSKSYYLLAAAYMAQNNRAQALAIYRRMMELFPQDRQPPFLVGSRLLEQGQRDEARKAFQKAVDISPDFLLAVERLVELDLLDKQYASAMDRVQKHLDNDPKSAVPWALRAKVYAAEGNANDAESDLLKAIELDPNLESAPIMLAQVYVALKKPEQAISTLKGYLIHNEKSIPALTQLATLNEQRKDPAGARETYEQILKLQPNSVFALNNLAAIHLNQLSELDRAAELAKKAREINPREPHVADTLGWILFKKGDFQNARRLLEESAGKLPDHPVVHYHLGMSYYMLGEEDPARAAFQTAAKSTVEFPGKGEIAQRLAILALKPYDAGARGELEAFLQRQPSDPVALTRLAQVLQASGSAQEAAQLYEKVVSANANFAPAVRELAMIYVRRSPSDSRTLELTQTARRAYPQDPEVARALGIVNFQRAIYPRAAELLQEARVKFPDDPEILYYLGQAHYQLKQPKECQAVLERAIASSSPNKFTGESKRTLEQCMDMQIGQP